MRRAAVAYKRREPKNMNTSSSLDEELYAAFLSHGDQGAMEELVARWHGAAYRVARCICRKHELAEEAVQDAFLNLLSRKAHFKSQGTGSFRAWLLSLVTNSARMARRKEMRAEARKRIEPRDFVLRKGLDRIPAHAAPEHSWCTLLARTLEGIEERWRTPILMHFMNGMPQKEIALSTGVSQQMISKRLSEGLAHLRAQML